MYNKFKIFELQNEMNKFNLFWLFFQRNNDNSILIQMQELIYFFIEPTVLSALIFLFIKIYNETCVFIYIQIQRNNDYYEAKLNKFFIGLYHFVLKAPI